MGMFDEVKLPCPFCGHVNYEQTKAGPCDCEQYDLKDAPAACVEAISDWTIRCGRCHKPFHVESEINVTAEIKPGEAIDEL